MTSGEYARRIAIAAGIATLFVAGLLVLRYLANTLLVVFAALLLAVVLDGAGRNVHRWTGLPRKPAMLLVAVVVLGALGLVAWWSGPRIGQQFAELAERIPETVRDVRDGIRGTEWGGSLLERLDDNGGMVPSMGTMVGGVTGAFSSIIGTVANLLIILFVGIYLAYEPSLYRDAVVRLAPAERRERFRDVLSATGSALRLWMMGQLGSMAVVGVLTAVALSIAGVPLALALGVIAGLLSFVPILGPLMSAVPALIIGLGAGGLRMALVVGLIYLGVQSVESYLITPLIQKSVVALPPALLLAAQVVMGVLFGLSGIFLATPLTVVAVVLTQMLYVNGVLGDDVEVIGAR